VFFKKKRDYRASEHRFKRTFGKGRNVMNKKSASRRPRRQAQHRLKPVYAAVLLAFSVQSAQANPIGGSVVNGSASFATAGNTLTVTNTPGTIINWQGFSINSNEITNFAQQSASSAVLNRVVGSDPSNIMGTLRSNGRVFLVNPNGILFGAGAVVDVAGLVASTLNLSNADFLAGKNHFTQVPGAGNVSNAGSITAQDNGQIYLIAPNVENTGVITAPNGEILLAAGYSVDLVSTDDPNLRVNITAPAGDATNVGQLIASSGSLGLFGTVVSNSGVVSADSATLQGGKIVFKATQRTEISGTVSANGITGGNIEVLGNQVGIMDGVTVTANGTQSGGTILVGGDYQGKNQDVPNAQVTYVAPSANIHADATDNGNGGRVIVWADDTTRFYGSISARGGNKGGNGGFVETSGHNYLDFQGMVDTRAPQGKAGILLLDPADIAIDNSTDSLAGGTISAGIFSGATGNSTLTWATIDAQLNLGSLTIQTNSAGTGGVGDININAGTTLTGAGALTLLANNNINIGTGVAVSAAGDVNLIAGWNNTGWAVTPGTGNITFNTGSSLSTPGNLYFNAGNSVTGVGATISANTLSIGNTNGNSLPGGVNLPGANMVNTLAVQIDSTTGSLTFSNGQALTIGPGTYFNGIVATGNTNPISITTTAGDITVNQNVTSAGSVLITSAGAITVNATVTNTSTGGLSLVTAGGSITLGGDISLTGGAFYANAPGATISMTGALSANTFTLGSGSTWKQVSATLPVFAITNNFSITGATFIRALGGDGIATPYRLADIYGVQGMGSVGMLANSYVLANDIDASVTAGWLDANGKPVGFAPIGTVYPNYFTGQFDGQGHAISNLFINQSGASDVGLFGYVSNGSISNVGLVNASVSGASDVGGLVGYNSGGNISNSYSSGGTVSATGNNAGGLVGYNTYSSGIVSASYVKGGSVTGASDVGGLVGYSYLGSISGSHVDSVSVTGSGNYIGGLVGYIASITDGGCLCVNISNSYVNNGTVSGASSVGGLAGYDSGADISGSYVSGGTVSATGNNAGGLVGHSSMGITGSSGAISASYVNGAGVTGGSNVGGLVGINGTGTGGSVGNNITGSYVNGGTVNGTGSDVGGLVGYNAGNVSSSYVSGSTVTGGSNVGGLVGQNIGGTGGAGLSGSVTTPGAQGATGATTTISNSYVSGGTVNGGSNVGGLVGLNSLGITGPAGTGINPGPGGLGGAAVISNSYVSGGTITATGSDVGGLVGNNAGDVSGNYVNGASVISAVSDGSGNGGGLVGYNSGTISISYASNGSVSANGLAWYMGGLVGENAGSISNTYASGGSVSGVSISDAGGLVGYNNGGTISNSYASNGVVSGGTMGGLVGYNLGSVNASFWNTTVAGTGVSFGIGNDAGSGGTDNGAAGLTSTGMMTMSNFTAAGWDISASGSGTIWRIQEGVTMPLLSIFGTGTAVVSNVINELVDITDQRPKRKPVEVLADGSSPGDSGNQQTLPMCN
jgi:filamentous hemagglutinin family protein